MAISVTDHINMDDYVMIFQDGCITHIRFEDFISGITLGGFSVCQAFLNCVGGIGVFPDNPPPINERPQMQDLYISLENRQLDKKFTADDFLTKYYDAEGDALGKIIITGGDVTGYSLNGQPVYIGMLIPVDQLMDIEYDAKNQDAAYTQDLFFEAYDVNNIKAESI